ncbi:MAG TPA: phosphate ABC transporter substrate-binding protein PstS [Acidothermaceae bacterium]
MRSAYQNDLYARRTPAVARVARLVVAAAAVALGVGALTPPPAEATTHSQIVADGSSWAANAVNTWVPSVVPQGLQVVFTSTGSAQGRSDFASSTVDFAVSDIGYQGKDPLTGAADSSTRQYAYLPIVSGGTSFPYHLIVNGKMWTSLRLSGQTLAKIFTNQITNWNDAAITTDNNGVALPSLPIVPIVHSEGSGSTYQFTAYLAQQFPSIWQAFAGADVPTEYWPSGKGKQISESGSDGVVNYLTSSSGNGSIAYDEYSYPLGAGYPAAKVLNSAGYFTLPTQYNVAVALTQAQIDPTTLLQNLQNVYTYNDPRTYPLSSYSYAVIPTSATDSKENTGKRQTMADFLDYAVCQGQAEIGSVGYSALPINLVEDSFARIALLHTADPAVDVSQAAVTSCNNPTFVANDPSANHLAQVAPQPLACDKEAAGPCGTTNAASPAPSASSSASPSATGTSGSGGGGSTTTATGSTTKTATGSSTTGSTTTGSTTKTGTTTTSGNRSGAAATGATNSNTGGSSTGAQVDPATGQVIVAPVVGGSTAPGDSDGQASGGTGSDTNAAGAQTPLVQAAANVGPGQGDDATLGVLAVILLLAALIAPPFLSRRFSRGPSQ